MPLPSKGTLGYLAARTYLRMRQKGPSALRVKVGRDRPFLPGSTVAAQLGTWPSGDVERIRHKALKTSSAPRDQGIAAKDNGGAESIADSPKGEGAARPKELDTEQTVLKNLYMSQELPLNPEVRKVIYYLYWIVI